MTTNSYTGYRIQQGRSLAILTPSTSHRTHTYSGSRGSSANTLRPGGRPAAAAVESKQIAGKSASIRVQLRISPGLLEHLSEWKKERDGDDEDGRRIITHADQANGIRRQVRGRALLRSTQRQEFPKNDGNFEKPLEMCGAIFGLEIDIQRKKRTEISQKRQNRHVMPVDSLTVIDAKSPTKRPSMVLVDWSTPGHSRMPPTQTDTRRWRSGPGQMPNTVTQSRGAGENSAESCVA